MRLIKYLLFALFCCISLSNVYSENLPLDTLLTRYYEHAASLMGEGELDSAQWYFNQAFATKGVKTSPVYPILLNEQGTLFFYFGKLEEARETKKAVLPYLPQLNDLEKHVSVYNDLGILYHRFNQNDSSMYYYHKALDAAERYQDAGWLANLHMNVSVFYFNMKHFDKAERHIDQAVKYVVQTDDRQTMLYTWQVRAGIKAQIGKLEESGQSMQKAWALATDKGGNTDWKMRCIPSLYRYFVNSHQPDSVRYYITIGNQLEKQLPANSISVTGFIQVRQEYNYEHGHYKEALSDLMRLSQYQAGTNKLGLYEKMARCYQMLGKSHEAFAYMDSARMWTDSLSKEKVTQEMADFEVKYQTQAKELAIAQLHQQVSKRESALWRIGFVVLALLVLLLLCFLYYRQKQFKIKQQLKRLQQEKELTAAQSYIEGMEEECTYFAKELHDGIANDLLGLQMKATVSDEKEMKEIPALIGKIRNEVRNISHELMPPAFDVLSLPEILKHYAITLQENSGVHTSFAYINEVEQAATEVTNSKSAREIYRIVQEVTSNSIKHGSASTIDITLKRTNQGSCQLSIIDDGKTYDDTDPKGTMKGIGLRTIDDRLKALEANVKRQRKNNCNRLLVTFTPKQL